MKKKYLFFITALLALCISSFSASAAVNPNSLRWSKEITKKGELGGTLTVRATFYSAEFIEAVLNYEAEQNMWTAAELEDYKYNFLKNLKLDKFIPIHLEISNNGPTAHMSPFNEMVSLQIGKKKHAPLEFEQRFNLPLQGKRDGMIYFPRYDEKTGKPLLDGAKTVKFTLRSVVLPLVQDRGDLDFLWDVAGDDMKQIVGTGADRIELDRLIRRVEKLMEEKKKIEDDLANKNKELQEVNARIEEIQNR